MYLIKVVKTSFCFFFLCKEAYSLTYFYVYLDQQGAEMLEMQQMPPQEQGYSQLFQPTNNKINNNYPFYYWFSSLFD